MISFLGLITFTFQQLSSQPFSPSPGEKKNVQVTYQIGGSGSGVTVGLGVLSWGLFGGFCWYWSNGVWWQISTKPWKPKHSQKNAEFGNLGGSKHHSKPPKNPAGNDPKHKLTTIFSSCFLHLRTSTLPEKLEVLFVDRQSGVWIQESTYGAGYPFQRVLSLDLPHLKAPLSKDKK